MEMMELMKQRHSVRQYTDRVIEAEKRSALDELTAALNRKFGVHMQIIYDEPQCFDSMMAHYGKFTGVKNYIALVGVKSPALDETLGRAAGAESAGVGTEHLLGGHDARKEQGRDRKR